MVEYIVTKVRKGIVVGGHIRAHRGCVRERRSLHPHQVVESIAANNVWKTQVDGYESIIESIAFCSKPRRTATPYIVTNPDSTKKDNLENLDRC